MSQKLVRTFGPRAGSGSWSISGLATTFQLVGEHAGKRTAGHRNPRVADLVSDEALVQRASFPRYGDLAVFDLFSNRTSKTKLAAKGNMFLQSVVANCTGCNDLLETWMERRSAVCG